MLNVGLHMLTVWLVYLLARRLRAMRVAALVAALVFGVHAIHSEVVAGVVGRAELLAFVFGAAGTLCFSHGYSAAGGRRAARWAAAALLLLLGFCSKEIALVWAPVMVVFEMARAWRADPTARVVNAVVKPAAWALVVSAMPVAMFFVLRARMIGNLPPGAAAAWSAAREQTFAGIRPATGFVQWGYAFVITLLPFKLASNYGPAVFTPVESLGDPRFLLAFFAAGHGPRRRLARRPPPTAAVRRGRLLFQLQLPDLERADAHRYGVRRASLLHAEPGPVLRRGMAG